MRASRGAARIAWVVGILGVIAALGLSLVVRRDRQVNIDERLRIFAVGAATRLQDTLSQYDDLLRSARGLFAASEEVRPDEFEDFAASLRLEERYPAARGLYFAERQTVGDVDRLLIRTGSTADGVGAAIILDEVARQALEQARDSDRAAIVDAAGLVDVPQGAGGFGAIGLALPVDEHGWVIGVLLVDGLTADALGDLEEGITAELLLPGEDVGVPIWPPGGEVQPSAPFHDAEIDAYGFPVAIRFRALPSLVPLLERWAWMLALATGLGVTALIASVVRILELRMMVARERQVAARLRVVDEMKDGFLVSVSHELRTPLTAIVGYGETLLHHGDRIGVRQARDLLERLVGNSRRLEGLLTDLLDLDRLSRGLVEPRRRSTDVESLVLRVLERVWLDGRDVEVDMTGVVAWVDPALVERAIESMLANVAKHTPPGTPARIGASRSDDGVLVAVEDGGNGVPDRLKERVFEPFAHGEAPSHSPGTGLGLALVQRVATLHGGRAWVEDRPGGGAAFRLYLRDAQSTAAETLEIAAATSAQSASVNADPTPTRKDRATSSSVRRHRPGP